MILYFRYYVLFFFNQKTAYDMRISDWSSDVCSSDLHPAVGLQSERTALPVADDAAGTLHHGGNRQVVIRLQAAVYYRVDLPRRELRIGEIGRESCRARVRQYVLIQVVAVSFNKKITITE